MEIQKRPYSLLLYSGLLLALISFFVSRPYGELHLTDTYIIAPLAPFLQFAGAILIIIWAIYLLTACFMHSVKLTWIHVLLTLSGTITFIILITRGSDESVGVEGSIIESTGFTVGILNPLIIAVLAQLIFFVNLALGLLKK